MTPPQRDRIARAAMRWAREHGDLSEPWTCKKCVRLVKACAAAKKEKRK